MSIEIESYLTEIDSDNVCGKNLQYDADFIALEKEVQGKEEQLMGDSVIEAEPPHWGEVIIQAENLLSRTRDLRVFMIYLRALTETQGLLGLADGTHLLKSIIEKRWETIHPQLDPDDDNDPTERINILMALCDLDSFLKPLHNVSLVESVVLGHFTLRDIQIANGSLMVTKPDNETELPALAIIEAAFNECEAETLLATTDAASDALQNINQIESFITEQVGVNNAVSFAELRTLLKEIKVILDEQVENRNLNGLGDGAGAGGENNSENKINAQSENTRSGKKSGLQVINCNHDVIKALNLVCEYYTKNEPSSPIPLLLERVVRLVGKDFMQVIQDMAPNSVEQVEFLRGKPNHDE